MPDRPMTGDEAHWPDVETLAAYADGTLDVRTRERVEAHLAECEDCYELMMEVVRSQEMTGSVPAPVPIQAVDDEGTTVVRPVFGRKRAWAVAASALALAAALLLVVRVQPQWWQRLMGEPGVNPRMETLIAAVGSDRTVEARLSSGFQYGPLRSQTRGPSGGAPNLLLMSAALEVLQMAAADPSAENLHAAGVAELLLDRHDDAIRTLEKASAADAENARILADLSAALLARGRAQNAEADAQRALDVADRALRLAPDLEEALFNRALALEALARKAEAQRAWQEYLNRDPDSGWAAEARRRVP